MRLEGYGLSLNTVRQTMRFRRWDAGGVRDPGAEMALPKLPERIEIALWAVGSNFSATVYDAVSKTELGTVTWSDAAYSSGFVGLYRKGMTVGRARLDLPQYAPQPPQRPWLARQWLAYLNPHDVARIDPKLSSLFVVRRLRDADAMALITNEKGLAVLGELQIEPLQVQPGVPYSLRLRRFDGLRDAQAIADEMYALAAAHSDHASLVTVGSSAEGRRIEGLRITAPGSSEGRPAILLCAAHHANEASTPEFVLDAARYLLERRDQPRVQRWLDGLVVVVVPMVNPDGSHAFWYIDDQFGRKNRSRPLAGLANHGVDLNRNYPFQWGGRETRYNSAVPESDFFRGSEPASEPEVQAMIALAHRERFVAAVSYHEAATRILVPYTIDAVPNPEPSTAWTLARDMADQLPHSFQGRRYTPVRSLYYVRGTEQDWYHHTFGTMAYLLEVPHRRARGERLHAAIVHSRPAWMYLLDRWLAGPSVSVRVTHATSGERLAVGVRLEEIQHRAQERWTTHPDHGWFHHYLPKPGTYTVVLEHDGRAVRRTVTVDRGVSTLEVPWREPASVVSGTLDPQLHELAH